MYNLNAFLASLITTKMTTSYAIAVANSLETCFGETSIRE